MSTCSPRHQPYQLFTGPHAFAFTRYDAPGSKMPSSSSITHAGLSPEPLASEPISSHDPLQSSDLLGSNSSDQFLWDNVSLSNSPVSIKTPDCDSFDLDMVDSESMRDFYHHQTENATSTHNPCTALAASDSSSTFSDQAIQAVLDATMADLESYEQLFDAQQQQLQQSHDLPTLLPQNNVSSQTRLFPPTHIDQWNNQGSSHLALVPPSNYPVADLLPNSIDFSTYLNNVNLGLMNHNNMRYMASSSSESNAPLFEDMLKSAQDFTHRPQIKIPQAHNQDHSPTETRFIGASPLPEQQEFINYNASSSIFAEASTTNTRLSPRSSITSLEGHCSHVPHHSTASPMVTSPCGPDGLVSPYQHSKSGMATDPLSLQRLGHKALLLPASPDLGYGSEVTGRSNKDHEFGTVRRNMTVKSLGKCGGRALGTHLQPKVAKAAHDMRKTVACWHCVLQRDKCGPGEVCERCLKRSQRPNADCGLGCSRIKLVDLSTYFLPALVMQIHENIHLSRMVKEYIEEWCNTELTVWMTCGQKGMPGMAVKVHEFVSQEDDLLVQIQYKVDPHTREMMEVRKQSPALGMVNIKYDEEKRYDQYVSDIVEDYLDGFGELCWKEDDNDFQQQLFRLMTRVRLQGKDEAKLLREVFRLIVVTFIMSHTLTIVEETKVATLSAMHSYNNPNSYIQDYTSPRLTNRQMKFFFSRLQRTIQNTVLNRLQQIFKSSRGCDKWLAAFVAVLGICMALEDQQKTIHLVMATKSSIERIDIRDAHSQADAACREIDARVHLIQQIFRWKYNRRCNPLRDPDIDWNQEIGLGDRQNINFVRQVAQLVTDNSDFLQQRQRISISWTNQTKYTSRLVAQFLLSFWIPSA